MNIDVLSQPKSQSLTTMRAVLVSKFVNEDGTLDKDAIRLTSGQVPKPTLGNPPNSQRRKLFKRLNSKQILVRVLCCAISPRDMFAMTGDTDLSPHHLPYVPASDVCGIVEDMEEGIKEIKVGDIVVGNTGEIPVGGLAEYAILDSTSVALNPVSVDVVSAASCASVAAAVYATNYVAKGQRVLVLGGSGGVGSCVIQLARNKGASFIAATSKQRSLVQRLGADVVVNYMKEDWFEKDEFTKYPFDVIIDCVGEPGSFERSANVLKPNGRRPGRFVAVAGEDRLPKSSFWRAFRNFHFRSPFAFCSPWLPTYEKIKTSRSGDEIAMVLRLVEDGELEIMMHSSAPFPFTNYCVNDAFRVQGSGHAHGKIVLSIMDVPLHHYADSKPY